MEAGRLAALKRHLHPPRDWMDWEFTTLLLGRPLGFCIVYLVEGVRWITPNLITVVAFLCMLAACVLLYAFPGQEVAACVLLFSRMVLDDTDGLLARFRGQCSAIGSYTDKVSDAIGFFCLFAVVGIRAADDSGFAAYPLLSVSGAFSLLLCGYLKQVVRVEQLRLEGVQNAADPGPMERFPPVLSFVAKVIPRLLFVAECDLFLVSIVLILAGRFDVLAWFFAATQGLGALAQIWRRGMTLHDLEGGKNG